MCCSYVYKKGEYLFYLHVFYLFIPRTAMDSLVLKVFDSMGSKPTVWSPPVAIWSQDFYLLLYVMCFGEDD